MFPVTKVHRVPCACPRKYIITGLRLMRHSKFLDTQEVNSRRLIPPLGKLSTLLEGGDPTKQQAQHLESTKFVQISNQRS